MFFFVAFPPQDGEEEEDLEMFAIICPICMSIGCIGLVDVENEYLFDFLFFVLLQHNASGLNEPTLPGSPSPPRR